MHEGHSPAQAAPPRAPSPSAVRQSLSSPPVPLRNSSRWCRSTRGGAGGTPGRPHNHPHSAGAVKSKRNRTAPPSAPASPPLPSQEEGDGGRDVHAPLDGEPPGAEQERRRTGPAEHGLKGRRNTSPRNGRDAQYKTTKGQGGNKQDSTPVSRLRALRRRPRPRPLMAVTAPWPATVAAANRNKEASVAP